MDTAVKRRDVVSGEEPYRRQLARRRKVDYRMVVGQ
jgi:hypothetical protein